MSGSRLGEIYSRGDKATSLIRSLPRIGLSNVEHLPDWKSVHYHLRKRGKNGGKTHGLGHKGAKARMRWPSLGYEPGNTPFQLKFSTERSYNYGWHAKRQYPPISLHTLQLMIDMGRLDAKAPIDLAALSNTKIYNIKPEHHHFGVNLTDEGIDSFKAKVNIEVQWASEQVIAAVERNGGVITTAYFDINSVCALINPKAFFESGSPIPRRMFPPKNAIDYYTNPANRGYLADPQKVAEERLVLSQKYGYELPDIDEQEDYMKEHKDPRQVFYGLNPGWVVNLKDKLIYKPLDPELVEHYSS